MKNALLKTVSALLCPLIISAGAAGCVGSDKNDHYDNNSDGTCDHCGSRISAELSLYAINDLHGKYMDTSSQPGVDEFTTYMKGLYSDTAREEILLSSGDMWQGTVESSLNRGQLLTEWMNELNFASMTLGNHEYDWGSDVLKPNSELARFPFLAINVLEDGKPADYCQPSVIVEKAGVKVGIIGAIGDCLGSISGDFTEGLEFATGGELTKLVKTESTRLKGEGCDFIVYSIHDGYGKSSSATAAQKVSKSDISHYYDVALSDGYVDLVFEGHTHQHYILQDDYGVYHIQGGGENSYVSCAEVSFNLLSGKYTVKPKLIGRSVYSASDIKGDPVVDKLYAKYFPESDPYTDVLGVLGGRKQSDEICKQIAKLYFDAGKEKWGASYNIVLGGGFLKLRSPYRLDAGAVTYADVFSVLPFDNELVLGKIRGSDLKSRFLSTDNSNYHVHSVLSASEVKDAEYYYIIVDSYSSTYKYNRITEVARMGAGRYARDLLAEFISGGGWSR